MNLIVLASKILSLLLQEEALARKSQRLQQVYESTSRRRKTLTKILIENDAVPPVLRKENLSSEELKSILKALTTESER